MIVNIFYGFCMALADSVPGVSGGTIAFILGFYEKLLDNVHNVFSKDNDKRKSAIPFIVKLLIGWAIGIGMSVVILSSLFESNIYTLSSVFLGLTVSSIPFIIISEKNDIKGNYSNLVFSILGIMLVVTISLLRSKVSSGTSIDFSDLKFIQYGYIFIASFILFISNNTSCPLLLIIFKTITP